MDCLASLQVLLGGEPARIHCCNANWMLLSHGVSLETALCKAFLLLGSVEMYGI